MSNARYDVAVDKEHIVNRKTTKLLYVTAAKYGGDWHSLMHTHASAEMFYVVGGQGQFKIGNQLIPVATNDLMIVNPNVEHTEVSLNARPLEYIVIGIEGLEFKNQNDSECGYSMLSLHNSADNVLSYLRSMLQEIETKQKGYELVCQDLLEILIIKVMRHADFSLSVSTARQGSKECAVVKRYMDSHFKENISLDMLADLVHINKYHLVHTFRKEHDITPISYLIERRIKESHYLLAETNHSLTQISQMLGFSSPSYFSQSFRRLSQMSPQEYRRISREQE